MRTELQNVQSASSSVQSEIPVDEHEKKVDAEAGEDAARSALVEKLENKKTESVILHLFKTIDV